MESPPAREGFLIFSRKILLRNLFREEKCFSINAIGSQNRFVKTKSAKYRANVVPQRRSVVLLAEVILSFRAARNACVEKSHPYFLRKILLRNLFREEKCFVKTKSAKYRANVVPQRRSVVLLKRGGHHLPPGPPPGKPGRVPGPPGCVEEPTKVMTPVTVKSTSFVSPP